MHNKVHKCNIRFTLYDTNRNFDYAEIYELDYRYNLFAIDAVFMQHMGDVRYYIYDNRDKLLSIVSKQIRKILPHISTTYQGKYFIVLSKYQIQEILNATTE